MHANKHIIYWQTAYTHMKNNTIHTLIKWNTTRMLDYYKLSNLNKTVVNGVWLMHPKTHIYFWLEGAYVRSTYFVIWPNRHVVLFDVSHPGLSFACTLVVVGTWTCCIITLYPVSQWYNLSFSCIRLDNWRML